MAETISIKERIERQTLLVVSQIEGIGRVFRWDGRGLRDPETGLDTDADGQRISAQNLDAVVIAEDESADEGGTGGEGYTQKILPLEVQLKLAQDEEDELPQAALINRWLYNLEKALMLDPLITEIYAGHGGPGGADQVRLAIDSRVTGTVQSPREEGQRETIVGIRIEVTYQHNRGDPAIGPGIAALIE